MPRLNNRLPKYREHTSGQAVVTIGGRDHYLGTHGSAASRREYQRLTAEWVNLGCPGAGLPDAGTADALTVKEMVLAFMRHAATYYGDSGNGQIQVSHFRQAAKPLVKLYGDTPARDFGPLALSAVRDLYVGNGWNRNYVNQQTYRLRRMFAWAVSKELIPPSDKVKALDAVEGLRKGRTTAREPGKVRPVSDAHLDQVIAAASPTVAAMLRLQRLTGMRPGEVCAMRTRDIDRSDPKLWTYTPESHKTEHHGVMRVVYLGPKAREILKPFLSLDPEARLFRPADNSRHARQKRAKKRTTPLNQGNAPGTAVKARPAKVPGKAYTNATYRQAVEYACDAAFPLPAELAPRLVPRSTGRKDAMKRESREMWWNRLTDEEQQAVKNWRKVHRFHPHQVRHTAATEMRRAHGLEAAQVLLGHRQLSATQIYAEQDLQQARKIAAKLG